MSNEARGQKQLPLLRPAALAYDAAGDLFIADADRNEVVEIAISGVITVVAGNGIQGFAGDGGVATAAELDAPQGLAVSGDGSIYIADTGNHRIREVRDGQITTFAGSGVQGFAGDGGPALAAAFDHPVALTLDGTGALLIADQANHRVRRVVDGAVNTLAGNGVQGYSGDGGGAADAELNEPSGIAVTPAGNLYIADSGNHRVRVVTADGHIATYAGSGVAGFSGDGGQATIARLNRPGGLSVDQSGDLLIADENNQRVRMVAPGGLISTVAGTGVQATGSEGSAAASTSVNLPAATAVSSFGWPAFADIGGRTVRVLLADGKLYGVAGLSARTTQISASTPDAVYGTAQASVSVAASPGAPKGAVQVFEGGTAVAESVVNPGGANVALPMLSAGTHTLKTVYSGDGVHPAATASSTISVAPALVTASAANATVSYGSPVPALTGSVNGILSQDAGKVTPAFAAAAPSMAPVGTYPISATLTGAASADYTVTLSPQSGSLTIVPAATIATLAMPGATYDGLPLQLSVRVASTTSGVPSGSVQFRDGGAVIASAMLVNGSASAIYLAPAAGTHALTASYSGDGNFLSSTSDNVAAEVAAMPDFGVTVGGSAQQVVPAGSPASYALNVAAQGAAPFTGAVMLIASGLPPGASASFSPAAVVPGTSSVPVTMTVATVASTAQVHSEDRELAAVLVGGVLLMLFWRRGMAGLLVCLASIALILTAGGCGARTVSESRLPVQSYTITVKATSTNLAGKVVVHSVDVILGLQ